MVVTWHDGTFWQLTVLTARTSAPASATGLSVSANAPSQRHSWPLVSGRSLYVLHDCAFAYRRIKHDKRMHHACTCAPYAACRIACPPYFTSFSIVHCSEHTASPRLTIQAYPPRRRDVWYDEELNTPVGRPPLLVLRVGHRQAVAKGMVHQPGRCHTPHGHKCVMHGH
eukprot:scaffold25860_cov105-Isochrysis_galbana.AAC.2